MVVVALWIKSMRAGCAAASGHCRDHELRVRSASSRRPGARTFGQLAARAADEGDDPGSLEPRHWRAPRSRNSAAERDGVQSWMSRLRGIEVEDDVRRDGDAGEDVQERSSRCRPRRDQSSVFGPGPTR